MNYLAKVKQFHRLFKQPILNFPTIIDENRFRFRVGLLEEELQELTTAYSQGNKTEMLDALGDLQYVLSGMILELGYKDVFDDAFQDIHDSNMSKACTSEEEMFDTINAYKEKGIECWGKKVGNKYLIYRSSDDKVMKSINYYAVNLKCYTDE